MFFEANRLAHFVSIHSLSLAAALGMITKTIHAMLNKMNLYFYFKGFLGYFCKPSDTEKWLAFLYGYIERERHAFPHCS